MPETFVMEPVEVDDVTMAFPASVTQKYMIPYSDIPDEYKNGNTDGNKFFCDMFYAGVKDIEMIPKEGIDPDKAWRHIRSIAGSFEPKHEHKEACIAYLLEQWFSKLSWKKADT